MDAIKSFAPTAALLFFAIIYFGTMIDVGLFDPLIRFDPAGGAATARSGW